MFRACIFRLQHLGCELLASDSSLLVRETGTLVLRLVAEGKQMKKLEGM